MARNIIFNGQRIVQKKIEVSNKLVVLESRPYRGSLIGKYFPEYDFYLEDRKK